MKEEENMMQSKQNILFSSIVVSIVIGWLGNTAQQKYHYIYITHNVHRMYANADFDTQHT